MNKLHRAGLRPPNAACLASRKKIRPGGCVYDGDEGIGDVNLLIVTLIVANE